MNVLIAGATGNLGSHLTRYLTNSSHQVRIMVHLRPPSFDINSRANVSIVHADLEEPSTLKEACKGMDCVVHLAGVLFRPKPETFLHKTNVLYLQNLANAALYAGVKKYVLVSFPHVEGETFPDSPAKGELDTQPVGLHGQTRLEAGRYLIEVCKTGKMTAVIWSGLRKCIL
jgi:nucleoside-diphosphate-sugar epimerase